jgi:histidinol-phosphate aminotransferase
MSLPTPRPNLLTLRPYQAAGGFIARHNLSANESCLGASPAAIEAAAAAAGLHLYPDGACGELRAAIAERYGIEADAIACGTGSEELISLLVQAYAAPDEEVVLSQYAFIKYELAARAHGAVPVKAPESRFTASVDALLTAVTSRTRIVFLANPNNPTGTYLPADEVQRLRDGLREDIVLAIDAAYAEYVTREDYSDGLALARTTPNTLMLRTFSKIHGLAGARLGWCFGAPPLIDALNKVRDVFNVSSVAQAAGTAAIRDLEHERQAREHNARWLGWLAARLTELGIDVTPSAGNFVMARFADPDACVAANAALVAAGILVMPLAGYGLPEALRITVGAAHANEALVQALATRSATPLRESLPCKS